MDRKQNAKFTTVASRGKVGTGMGKRREKITSQVMFCFLS